MLSKSRQGMVLVALTAVATLWLAIAGKLTLYINPRYVVFTVLAAGLSVLAVLYGWRYAGDDGHIHDDEPDRHPPVVKPLPGRWRSGWRLSVRAARAAAAVAVVFAAAGLLLSRPLPLTSATALQRGINTAGAAGTTSGGGTAAASAQGQGLTPPLIASDDYSGLKIKDWAGLLSQFNDPAFFAGKRVSVTGFVVPDPDDRRLFYVSRFVITCCAVDARPVGLAVYAPGWQASFGKDDWVRVEGPFAANPSLLNKEAVVIRPTLTQKTARPEQAYDY